MKKVAWKNLWNWRAEEGGTTRLHLTESETLAGSTLCGRTFPRNKGYPTAVSYCKQCVKKSGMAVKDIQALGYVDSVVD